MTILVSLCLALLLTIVFTEQLKKNANIFYIIATLIALVSVAVVWLGITLPEWVNLWLIPILAKGGLTGAFFIIVMFAGAFPNRSLGAKLFMPLRSQLSIIASILGIGHGLAYSKSYFLMMKNGSSNMKISTVVFIIISALMFAIMIPLFVTSFTSVKRKMKGGNWKKLQRLAYVFYGLQYIHVMMLMVPPALKGTAGYDITIFVYSFIYISYLFCRCVKAFNKGINEIIPRRQLVGVAISLLASVVLVSVIYNQADASSKKEDVVYKSETITSVSKEFAEEGTSLKDGVYTGEGMGNNGTIAVEVTIENSKLTDIVITKFTDDKEYFDVEVDGKEMISRVLDAGDTEVDTISGATYSSEGFLSAVASAIEQAKK
ncbi:DMSO/TMAO reductase YedYZ, heme-binding membrane subunit [Pseudobutyrivibrio sp. YE44]|uniref:FMN-binding protein n=1 Tax=Pseudobutyrivibrio sp. YE44 TaxID=1520802 RepID=UPI00088188DC|nr:FMN-binding protein [Pseudobutyrivibrio sp. YE44]SDB19222.1 DMSO/TMAO reductase YedYZ, heme-binding membrane subunit [Pseudobutyrivibrio sp. YE44]